LILFPISSPSVLQARPTDSTIKIINILIINKKLIPLVGDSEKPYKKIYFQKS
jgi:hypothetical protein